ncbi:MAG TPA: DedA family protein [Candidatus Levybacteria bacterium]|nr:DedA family protein [Candidatus Levybacteria bacterium]
MEILTNIVNLFLHIDDQLAYIINLLGPLTYVVLFGVVFAETGLVITPFLPGDSLLFAAGALSGLGYLNIAVLYLSLLAAAILGDSLNYWIGNKIGPRVFARENSRVFKKEYLEKTREFYEKHGGKTIILARFIPIIRTFAPFVAGVGKMNYKSFLIYNVTGAFLWVTSFVFAGYFFGGLPFMQKNFHYAVVIIVFISLIPVVYEFVKHRYGHKLSRKQLLHANYSEVKKTVKKSTTEK